MSQKFASGRSVGTRLSAANFANYFRSKKRASDDRPGEAICEFQFDPHFKPFWLAHKKTNTSTAVILIISGALMFALSPFCSATVDERCWTNSKLISIYKKALENGENVEKIRWIYSLRYIGGVLLGLGIFYFILIVQYHIWRKRMGVMLINRQSVAAENCNKEEMHGSKFNVYDIMVKAWVREQRTVHKKTSEKEDENLPVIDTDSIASVQSTCYIPRSPVTYRF